MALAQNLEQLPSVKGDPAFLKRHYRNVILCGQTHTCMFLFENYEILITTEVKFTKY